VTPPEVLSFREFRAGLAATFKQVQEPDAEPVYVGAHRRPEAVVMSVAHYRDLVAASERRRAMVEALASVRAEGLEPGPDDASLLAAVSEGELSTDELRQQVIARYQRR
jgi:PHD/YefM family antitoxin component YafN of YafNO toxin-antitoxin module